MKNAIQYEVQPYYKYRADGKPGRALLLTCAEMTFHEAATWSIEVDNVREVVPASSGTLAENRSELLLPPGIGVEHEATVKVTLHNGEESLTQLVQVPAMRHWTVYVYPHSHVDIGYSNTQENVEFIHRRNIEQAILLDEATKAYPDGARYRWNPEVLWPYERYASSATGEQKARLKKAVSEGQLCLDAGYMHVNTSLLGEEEMFQFLRYRREIEQETGKKIDTFVQVDIPGLSWGMVPVLAHEGIRFVMSMINEGEQGPHARLRQRPFWWVGPDGISKVMYFTPGNYTVGTEKGRSTGRPWFGQLDTAKIPASIKTENPRALFLEDHLFTNLPLLEQKNHPYDIYVVTWALWDNALIDADLPDAVKSWNEEYAYPHLLMAGAHEIMETFEKKYGENLPVLKGDDTEYWTDGVGSGARETASNRRAKERLLQAETVWTMLNPGKRVPRAEFDEAWRRIILGTEHTWAFEIPQQHIFQNKLWHEKQRYFEKADEDSQKMLFQALIPALDKSDGCLGPFSGPANGGVAVLNTLSWSRGGLIVLSPDESSFGERVVNEQGQEMLSQKLSTGELAFLTEDIPGFASRHYRVVEGTCSRAGLTQATATTLENGLIKVSIDPANGNIAGLVDLSSGYNFADPAIEGGLNAFCYQPGSGSILHDSNVTITVRENGPLVAELCITSTAPGCRSVTRVVRLVHGQPWVEIVNTVDKLPLRAKDGVHFGFGFNVPESQTQVDIPWGIMRVEDDQWESANRNYLAVQHWLDISNESLGVTWCSLDAPLFEYGGITADHREPGEHGRIEKLQPGSTIYSYVMNNYWPTNFPLVQDGPVQFHYRIMPHGPYQASRANRFGVEQAQPLLAVTADSNCLAQPLLAMANENIAITILKSLDDGKAILLRARSFSRHDELLKITWIARQPVSLALCDEGEEPGVRNVNRDISVPALGIVVLRADWEETPTRQIL